MDNIPLGAENDPKAPFNSPLTEKRTCILSLVLSRTLDVDVPVDCDKDTLEEIIRSEINIPTSLKDWEQEDLIIE